MLRTPQGFFLAPAPPPRPSSAVDLFTKVRLC